MKQRGFAPVIIIFVLAILGIVGYIGYRSFRSISTSTSTPSTSQTPNGDLANWKTYTNSFYKYSFRYPIDLVLETTKGGAGIVTAGPDTKDFQMRSDKIVGEYVDVGALNYFADLISPTQWVRNNVEVGGQKIEAYKNKKVTTDKNKVLYRFRNQDNKIQVDFILTYPGEKSDLQETLNQVLSTFKFAQ